MHERSRCDNAVCSRSGAGLRERVRRHCHRDRDALRRDLECASVLQLPNEARQAGGSRAGVRRDRPRVGFYGTGTTPRQRGPDSPLLRYALRVRGQGAPVCHRCRPRHDRSAEKGTDGQCPEDAGRWPRVRADARRCRLAVGEPAPGVPVTRRGCTRFEQGRLLLCGPFRCVAERVGSGRDGLFPRASRRYRLQKGDFDQRETLSAPICSTHASTARHSTARTSPMP